MVPVARINPDRERDPSLTNRKVQLRLLLFVDERSSPQRHTQQIYEYLQVLKHDYPFELDVLEVGEHPDLAEHFRLIATPSLVRIHPNPKQTLAGGDLVAQLKQLWQQWQEELAMAQQPEGGDAAHLATNADCPIEQIQMTEEIFRLKRENAELLEQLHFKNQVLEMFVHDLRSPLTAASMAVDTLRVALSQRETSRAQELIPKLYQQAREQFRLMNRMISDILQATKGSSGALQIQLQALHLSPLCIELLNQLRERIQSHELTLIEDIPQDLPLVYADAELIRQVLTNLLDNAIKYTPPGGIITVSLLHRTSQKVQVSVADTGHGIPPETQEHIFEGHFRLKRDEQTEGYGIGLSLCRKVIQAHYGRIWVDSVPQEGSCFHFTLPVYR
jgi:two-component system clock-associated histidine kinase SasA